MGFGKKSSAPAPQPAAAAPAPAPQEKPIEREPAPVTQKGSVTSTTDASSSQVSDRDRSGNERTARTARSSSIRAANLIDAEGSGDVDPLIDRRRLNGQGGARLLS